LKAEDNISNMVGIPNSSFLATTRRLITFSNGKEPKPNDKIVYISGSFDLLHTGHVDMLKKAKA
jgi:ethanolamine-phosphate cytidylyltransferase